MSVVRAHMRRAKLLLVLAGGVLCLLGILIAVFFMWYQSDADIHAIKEAARSRGIPVSYEELYAEPIDQELRDVLLEVLVISEKHLLCLSDHLYEKEGVLGDIESYRNFSYGLPVYPHQGLDAVSAAYYQEGDFRAHVERVCVLLKAVKGRRLTVGPDEALGIPEISISEINELSLFLSDYAMTVDVALYNEIVEALLDLNELMPRNGLIAALCRIGALSQVGNLMCLRLQDLDVRHVERVVSMTDGLKSDTESMCLEVFVSLLAQSDQFVLIKESPLTITGGTDLGLVGKCVERFRLRLIRADAFEQMVALCALALQDGFQLDELRSLALQQKREADLSWRSQGLAFFQPGIVGGIDSCNRVVSFARLLLAEKTQQAWPNDAFGNPYVPVYKDDKLIGAYSCGEDGIDDGWDGESNPPYWFYGHLE